MSLDLGDLTLKNNNLLTLEVGSREEELILYDEERSSDYDRPHHKDEVVVISGSITVSP